MIKSEIKQMQREIALRPIKNALRETPFAFKSIGEVVLFVASMWAVFTLAGIFS